MHFAPVGRTGFGGWGILRDDESFEEFEDGRVLLVQIESPRGLAAMEEMISEYGPLIDGFVIGPNDYSIMMGVPRQLDHPLMLAEYEKFFAICKKHGKSCGIFDPDLDHARRDHAMGANIFWISDDFSCAKAGFEALLEGVQSL
jgi:2-keto-3-deoxy-L-rhamnonate aldolase RhmA